jgi:hypothetical protein
MTSTSDLRPCSGASQGAESEWDSSQKGAADIPTQPCRKDTTFRNLTRDGPASTLIPLVTEDIKGCGAPVQDHDLHRWWNTLRNDHDIEILCYTMGSVVSDRE